MRNLFGKNLFGGNLFGRKPAGRKRVQTRAQALEKKPQHLKTAEQSPAAVIAAHDDDATTIRYNRKESYVEIITAQATHVGTRAYQQDALTVTETTCFSPGETPKVYGIVCDGMGGLAEGGAVSTKTVELLAQKLDELTDFDDIPAFFRRQIFELDGLIAKQFGAGTAGTTLAVALIIGNRLYWSSVGDSRIYLFRKGEIVQVTHDHNLRLRLMQAVEEGRITSEEAEDHPQKDALISFIGSGSMDLIDANRDSFDLSSGDIVLVCSDGLTKSLSDEQINNVILNNYGDIKETARLLPLIAFDTGGAKDNTSVVLIQYFE
jgi:protein phosphatase